MIKDWIINGAATAGIEVRYLSPAHIRIIVEQIRSRFARTTDVSKRLWELFEEEVARPGSDGWRLLSDFDEPQPLLLFQDRSEFEGFALPSASALVAILAETPGFEFYVTNDAVDFVFCFNHHDYLIGVGSCRKWLLTMQEQEKEM